MFILLVLGGLCTYVRLFLGLTKRYVFFLLYVPLGKSPDAEGERFT
jgi:hypothetical protein